MVGLLLGRGSASSIFSILGVMISFGGHGEQEEKGDVLQQHLFSISLISHIAYYL